jgi:UDPglucose 6-dehydrogenase
MKPNHGKSKAENHLRQAAGADVAPAPSLPASDLRICVLGLWHLGSVTAACTARHFEVVGLDFDQANVARLNAGRAPLLEPGLDERIVTGLAAGRLSFTTDPQIACQNADLLWLCYDTPVNDRDESDTAFVLKNLSRALKFLPAGAWVLVSSQLPVGTCARLEKKFPRFHFACSPENLRLGRAVESFENAPRVVVGLRHPDQKALLEKLFAPFTSQILFLRTESAEMVKHALNSFLALSVAFINEVACLCERVGADAKEVSLGLKSDPRIGARAYLNPGGAFAGGTLARDVVTLTKLARTMKEKISVIPAIRSSNDRHRGWAFRKLQSRLGPLRGKKIALLGLTYTPNTDTLRRSAAVELCRRLLKAGAKVSAFDPAVKSLPKGLSKAELAPEIAPALNKADAAVVCTEWPQFRQADWPALAPLMRRKIFLDANRFLENELQALAGVEHLFVGHRP